MGAYAEHYETELVHAVYCPNANDPRSKASECAQWVSLGAHYGWRACWYMDACLTGSVATYQGDGKTFSKKFTAQSIDVVQTIMADGICFMRALESNQNVEATGCNQGLKINPELLPYPREPVTNDTIQHWRERFKADAPGTCRFS